MTNNRYLLYIDILGFSDLVKSDVRKVDDLYEVIASLNAHKHDAFKCVIFSDTILVYNLTGGHVPEDVSYIMMFMCEFARDLLHRLTGRGIQFRAIITHGNFRHYELNSIPCFYGTSLVKAYLAEKKIKAIGLFLEKSLRQFCDIFPTRPFNEESEFDFVYITQALDSLEKDSGGRFPMDIWYLEETELIWMATPELLHLVKLYQATQSDLLDKDVKEKYKTTIRYYDLQYPILTSFLASNNFDVTRIAPAAKWHEAFTRYPENYSPAVRNRKEF